MASETSRRQALKAMAAASALPVLNAQQHQHATDDKKMDAAPYKPQFFQPEEYALLGTLVDLIIPRTDTPGAVDAGVPVDIDRRAARDRKLGEQLRTGLGWLDRRAATLHGTNFGRLSEDRQIAILKPISEEPGTEPGAFFRIVKNLTVDAYYSSREGLQQELGWNANTYLPEFKGCTHPEHQA